MFTSKPLLLGDDTTDFKKTHPPSFYCLNQRCVGETSISRHINLPEVYWLVVSNKNFIFHVIYGMSSQPHWRTPSILLRCLLHHQSVRKKQKFFWLSDWMDPQSWCWDLRFVLNPHDPMLRDLWLTPWCSFAAMNHPFSECRFKSARCPKNEKSEFWVFKSAN